MQTVERATLRRALLSVLMSAAVRIDERNSTMLCKHNQIVAVLAMELAVMLHY
jgi:hypothetical protein